MNKIAFRDKIAFLAAAAIFAAASVNAAPAHAETWCLRGQDLAQTRICAFSSAQDCLRTARINPVGNICEQDTAVRPVPRMSASKTHARDTAGQRSGRGKDAD